MDYGAVFVATALAAAIGSIDHGIDRQISHCISTGNGFECLFCLHGRLDNGVPWQSALTGVLISGLIFIALTLSGIREKIINSIPAELKYAVGAGIGLFITFIGFQNAGIIVNNDAVLVGLGDLTKGTYITCGFRNCDHRYPHDKRGKGRYFHWDGCHGHCRHDRRIH